MDGGQKQMINLKVLHGLLFCELVVKYNGNEIKLENALVDTGSGGTILKAEIVEAIGIVMEPGDSIEVIRGVGGNEFVFIKRIDEISIDGLTVTEFETEIGAMEYGFPIDAIIGLDLLSKLEVKIDLKEYKIYI